MGGAASRAGGGRDDPKGRKETRARLVTLKMVRAALPFAFVDAYEVVEVDAYEDRECQFSARCRGSGSLRTVRCMSVSKKGSEATISMALYNLEQYVLDTLNHPNVVRLHETFYEARRKPALGVLVMDHAAGPRLSEELRSRKDCRMSENDAREVMVQLADVLRGCAESGIVCGSLDLDSVMLREKDSERLDVVLTTMRYACMIGQPLAYDMELVEYEIEDEMQETVTRTYAQCAGRSMHFMAPELLTPSLRPGLEPTVDVWSFGVIMYTVLAGYQPFDGEDEISLAEKIRSGTFVAFTYDSETWDSVSHGAKDLIAGCLRVRTSRRYTIDRILRHPWIRKYTDPDATFNALDSDSGLLTPPRSVSHDDGSSGAHGGE